MVPFGLGRRYCMGEQLARNKIFIFLADLLQQRRCGAIGPDGFRWINICPDEFRWINIGPDGFRWINIGLDGFRWINIGPDGFR